MEIAEDVYYTDAAGVQQTMDIAFVTTSHNKKLLIIDITNTPQIIKEINLTDVAGRVHYNKEHKLIFVQVGTNLLVYELNSMLSNNLQGEPRQVGMYEGGGWANDIIADDKYLYIGEWGNFRVLQYDPLYGLELVTKDAEFLEVQLPENEYYPALGTKEIWVKVKDDNNAGKYNTSGNIKDKDPERPVRIKVKEIKQVTIGGCYVVGVGDGKTEPAPVVDYSEMGMVGEKPLAACVDGKGCGARFRITCPSTVMEGKVEAIFEREVYKGEGTGGDPERLQGKAIITIKSNKNVKFNEVIAGREVYTQDADTESKSTSTYIGFNFVQELFNQVIPRKRGFVGYGLIDEDGKYGNTT